MGEIGRDSDLEDLESGVDGRVEVEVVEEEGGATAVATLLSWAGAPSPPVPATWGESTGGLRASLGGGGAFSVRLQVPPAVGWSFRRRVAVVDHGLPAPLTLVVRKLTACVVHGLHHPVPRRLIPNPALAAPILPGAVFCRQYRRNGGRNPPWASRILDIVSSATQQKVFTSAGRHDKTRGRGGGGSSPPPKRYAREP